MIVVQDWKNVWLLGTWALGDGYEPCSSQSCMPALLWSALFPLPEAAMVGARAAQRADLEVSPKVGVRKFGII